MKFKKEIEKSKNSYEKEWNYTSKYYYKQGYYDLLTSSIKNNSKILEIGSGSGYSTICLSKKAEKLITLDENIYCINSTYKKLIRLNIKSSKIERGKIKTNDELLSYTMEYDDFSIDDNCKVQCIEGDILQDDKLLTLIKSHQDFDVVTCWMMGAHGLILNHNEQIKKGRNFKNRTAQMVQDYKFDVLRQVANIASRILNKNGVLSIVERFSINVAKQFSEKELIQIFEDKIEPHGFQLNKFDFINIKTKSKMAMVNPNGILKQKEIGLLRMEFTKTIANNQYNQ